MKTATALVIVAAAAVAGAAVSDDSHNHAKRGCYKNGPDWGDSKGKAKESLATACDTYFSVKGGEKNWKGQEKGRKCYQLTDNLNVEFFLMNNQLPSQSDNLKAGDCYNEFVKEIDGCGQGGEHTYGSFLYRSDPNDGKCPQE